MLISTRICILSLITSEELLSIELDENDERRAEEELIHLARFSWSNNGKFLAFAHWSGLVSVYSSSDGQVIHRLTSKAVSSIFSNTRTERERERTFRSPTSKIR